MQKKIEYLKSLFKIKETVLVPEYHTVQRNFYSYLDKSGMSKPEYEAFVKELDFVMEKDGELIGQNMFMRDALTELKLKRKVKMKFT